MHVMIKATERCNMRCTYCYVPIEQRKSNNFLSEEHLSSLFRKIFDWQQSVGSSDKVQFNWAGGEMLTLPLSWWETMIRMQKEIHKTGDYTFGYINGVQTNLTLINKQNSKFFYDKNIILGTSMDGPKKYMDKTRVLANGKSAFDAILNNINHLKTAYDIVPGVILVLTKHNIGHLREIFSFFNDLKMGFQINPYHFTPSASKSHSSNAITSEEYLEGMCDLFDMWSERVNSVPITNFKRIIKFLLYGETEVCRDRPTCVNYFYVIRWNGEVYPCSEFSGDDFEKKYCYGNLINDSWQTIRDNSTRQMLLRRSSKLETVSRCKECRYWKGCHGGCLYCALKWQYRNSDDISPEAICITPDYEHCKITHGLYSYIEKHLKQKSSSEGLPIYLYVDKVSQDDRSRRIAFYKYQCELCKFQADEESENQLGLYFGMDRIAAFLPKKAKKILTCFLNKSSLALHAILKSSNKFVEVNSLCYHENESDERTNSKYVFRNNDHCNTDSTISFLLEDKITDKYDAYVVYLPSLYDKDIQDFICLCGQYLNDDGKVIVFTTRDELRIDGDADISYRKEITKFSPYVVNIQGLSIASISYDDIMNVYSGVTNEL